MVCSAKRSWRETQTNRRSASCGRAPVRFGRMFPSAKWRILWWTTICRALRSPHPTAALSGCSVGRMRSALLTATITQKRSSRPREAGRKTYTRACLQRLHRRNRGLLLLRAEQVSPSDLLSLPAFSARRVYGPSPPSRRLRRRKDCLRLDLPMEKDGTPDTFTLRCKVLCGPRPAKRRPPRTRFWLVRWWTATVLRLSA